MKKAVSLLLCVIILCMSMPAVAMASENDSERDQLIADACAVFPEYAGMIQNQEQNGIPKVVTRASTTNELVFSATRPVSDDKYILFSEYSDGTLLVTEYETKCTKTENSHSTSGSYKNYDVNIEATMAGVNGYFKVSNVKYSLITSQYDRITSTGTESKSGKCTSGTLSVSRLNETATQKATLIYDLYFQFGPGSYYTKWTELTFTVGGDTATLTHVDLDS